MLAIGTKIDETRIDGNLDFLRGDLEYFKNIGLKAIEIPVHGLDVVKNGRLDERRLSEVKNILEDYDFIYSVHAPNPLNLMDIVNAEIHLAVFRASLVFASEINSKVLVYHSGRYLAEEEFPIKKKVELTHSEKVNLLDFEAKTIKWLSKEYPNILICFENARPYLYNSPYCYAELLGSLKEQVLNIGEKNVRITLDIGHLYMASKFYGFDPVEETHQIGNLISHIHIHDNFGGSIYYHEKMQTHQIPFGRGDSHMPVGWGEIPINSILSTFIDNYGGILIMELRSRYFKYTKESAENLKNLLHFSEVSSCKSS